MYDCAVVFLCYCYMFCVFFFFFGGGGGGGGTSHIKHTTHEQNLLAEPPQTSCSRLTLAKMENVVVAFDPNPNLPSTLLEVS